jgi:hypothetical protein
MAHPASLRKGDALVISEPETISDPDSFIETELERSNRHLCDCDYNAAGYRKRTSERCPLHAQERFPRP